MFNNNLNLKAKHSTYDDEGGPSCDPLLHGTRTLVTTSSHAGVGRGGGESPVITTSSHVEGASWDSRDPPFVGWHGVRSPATHHLFLC